MQVGRQGLSKPHHFLPPVRCHAALRCRAVRSAVPPRRVAGCQGLGLTNGPPAFPLQTSSSASPTWHTAKGRTRCSSRGRPLAPTWGPSALRRLRARSRPSPASAVSLLTSRTASKQATCTGASHPHMQMPAIAVEATAGPRPPQSAHALSRSRQARFAHPLQASPRGRGQLLPCRRRRRAARASGGQLSYQAGTVRGHAARAPAGALSGGLCSSLYSLACGQSPATLLLRPAPSRGALAAALAAATPAAQTPTCWPLAALPSLRGGAARRLSCWPRPLSGGQTPRSMG
jgi:hypothetical protein